MSRLTKKGEINRLILLFTMTYLVSYVTRVNYSAIISEIEKQTHISKALLSLAVSGQFAAYGCGQLISGYLGDRIQPKKLFMSGILLASVMNVLLPFCEAAAGMIVVWSINGFAQALLWPPLVKAMSSLLSGEDYKRASTIVVWGSSLGTIVVYLVSPLIISVLSWKFVFFFSAAAGIVMLLFINKYCYEIDEIKAERQALPAGKKKSFPPVMILIMLAIILHGTLRDGVTTWIPSYISETYDISNILSILTGVLIPIFGILCLQATSVLYRKCVHNPLVCAGLLFGTGFLAAILLSLSTGESAAASIVFSALLTGCMHGVNLILICMLPQFFYKTGNVSTVSGILNSCTYVGSAISTYGIPLLSENNGWGLTVRIWLGVAAVGTVFCFLSARPWKRFQKAVDHTNLKG